jgi:taspase (threonine aspartase 1)
VGQGATDFAYEHGLVVLPHDGLIAPAAKERWHRWRLELEEAEFKERQQDPSKYQNAQYMAYFRHPIGAHPAQLLASPLSAQNDFPIGSPLALPTENLDSFSDVVCAGNPNPILTSPLPYNAMPSFVTARDGECSDGIPVPQHVSANANDTEAHATVSMDSESRAHISSDTHRNVDPEDLLSEFEMDQISDTVGAIAIDSVGNIAAGSSSGGIGMKHRGRIGPAALVGVGTTVIPVDPNDPEKTCVATVTSGTGEHIATTMAASVCSTRVYYCQKKCEDGTFEEATEDDAMRTMIESEFMGRPVSARCICCNGLTPSRPPRCERQSLPWCYWNYVRQKDHRWGVSFLWAQYGFLRKYYLYHQTSITNCKSGACFHGYQGQKASFCDVSQ